MASDSLRSEIEAIRDRHVNAAREATELLALKWPEVYGRGPVTPKPVSVGAPAAKKAPASKPAAGAKRSPLTVAKQRIGQAKRRGNEPKAEDVALVAAAEAQAAE